MLRIAGVLGILAIAAFVTRPSEAALSAAANAKLKAITEAAAENVDFGGALGGLAAQAAGGRYDNYYVVSRYSVPANDAPLVECWGLFTQAICNKVGSPQ